MNPHPAQPDEVPSLDAESPAGAWIAASIAILMTIVSLLAVAFA